MVIAKIKNTLFKKFLNNLDNSLKKRFVAFSSSTKNKTIDTDIKKRSIVFYRTRLTGTTLTNIIDIEWYKKSDYNKGIELTRLKNIFILEKFGKKLVDIRSLLNPFGENKSYIFLTPIDSDTALDLGQAEFHLDVLVVFKKQVNVTFRNISTIHKNRIKSDKKKLVLNWTCLYSGRGSAFVIPRKDATNFLLILVRNVYPAWILMSGLSFFCCPQGKNLKETW